MRRFGVLVPSTNTTVETEYGRLVPATLQLHVARIPLLSSGAEVTPRSGDADVDYQARLLGHAGVEVVALAQTAASLSADDYDDRITRRMSEAAGVPAITSARAIGLAVRALGARRIALVAPFPIATNRQTRTPLYRQPWPGDCRERRASPAPIRSCIRRSHRAWPAMRSGVAIGRRLRYSSFPGGNFPTMTFISEWEHAVGKPVITTNQAALWAMIRIIRANETLPGFGRLLEEMPGI